jgi:hypothetical protein
MDSRSDQNSIKLLFTVSRAHPPSFLATHKHFQNNDTVLLQINCSFERVKQLLESNQKCILVHTLITSADVSEFLGFLQSIRPHVRSKIITPIAFLKLNSDKIEDALRKMGCAEMLVFDLQSKAFIHKITRHIKSLEKVTGAMELDGEFFSRSLQTSARP